MISHSTAPLAEKRPSPLDDLAEGTIRLGHDVVCLSGFVDGLDLTTQGQVALMQQARAAVEAVGRANADVRAASELLVTAADATMAVVARSSGQIRENSAQAQKVAAWVQTLDARMIEVATTLRTMQASASQIGEIALQVNILAINAKIEAARAGDAGRGFSVVAEEINNLSRRTALATESIRTSIEGLASGIGGLRQEAEEVATTASAALVKASGIDDALADISHQVRVGQDAAQTIDLHATQVKAANDLFEPVFARVVDSASDTAEQVKTAQHDVGALIRLSESMVQAAVELGADTEDAPMIALVQSIAARMGGAMKAAVAEGRISAPDLFDMRYRPIPGTQPLQVLAPFSAFTDRLFPPFQDSALKSDPRVVFCAAVDRNGYLPTHNRKFSAPQGADPVWNAANCRNRRIFDDRVGLAAGRSTAPFLMQIYRRDMGGGSFRMMKDLSAPITVNGRHWGGLRLAYTF